jgi:hypothetical protein
MSSIKKRVMSKILEGRDPVWMKDYPHEKSKQDGLFTSLDGTICIYKTTLRNNQKKFTEHPFYYLETSIVNDLAKWHKLKGLNMGYFIIWKEDISRHYGYMFFNVLKYLEKYNWDPPQKQLLMNKTTYGFSDEKELKWNVVFDTFDITKEGSVLIDIEKNIKKMKWKPRK